MCFREQPPTPEEARGLASSSTFRGAGASALGEGRLLGRGGGGGAFQALRPRDSKPTGPAKDGVCFANKCFLSCNVDLNGTVQI